MDKRPLKSPVRNQIDPLIPKIPLFFLEDPTLRAVVGTIIINVPKGIVLIAKEILHDEESGTSFGTEESEKELEERESRERKASELLREKTGGFDDQSELL